MFGIFKVEAKRLWTAPLGRERWGRTVRKKGYLALLLAFCVALALAGCAPRDPAAGEPSAEASFAPWKGVDKFPRLGQYVMEIGHVQPEDNPRHLSLLQFKEDVENATCGHVRVVVRPNGELGTEEELLQKTMAGTIQGMRGGQYQYSPRLLMFTLPFLTQSRAQVDALLQSDLARRVCQEAGERTGTVILNLCDAGGYRQFSNAVRPIHAPQDVAGLRMRYNGMEVVRLTLETLGAEAVYIDYGSLYTALSSGVADGQENPWINIQQMKFYEVQPYFTELNYQFHPDPFFVNAAWWQSLPQELREVILPCAAEMGAYNDRLIDQNNQAARDAVAAAGAEIYTPTREELEAFRQAVEPVYDQCIDQGICTADELAEMRQIVEEAG